MKRLVTSYMVLISLCYMVEAQDRFAQYGWQHIDYFKDFLAIPNDANNLDDINKNVNWLRGEMEDLGFVTTTLKTPTRPLLYAEMSQNGLEAPTVLFYFHADGQSVDPQFWFQSDPYQAVLKKSVEGEGWLEVSWDDIESIDPEYRIFARSSSDSKGNIIMFLLAMQMLQQDNIEVPYNLKVIVDFEEEKSSPSLPSAVNQYQELLASDMLVIFDGPRHVSGQPTISYGARGIAVVTLTVYGPYFSQHSGHYGNYVPNPALRLSQLLASMKDDNGRVTIPGFYDGIEIDDQVMSILDQVPDDEKLLQAKLGIAQPDSVADSYQKSLQYPSLNIRGLASGWVGRESRTIVPSQAVAEIDIRLVMESDPHRLIELLTRHIRSQGYFITTEKPTATERLTHRKICRMNSSVSYGAFRTDFDSDIGRWLTKAMISAFDRVPVRERTMGGSIPISPFVNTLNVPAVVVPLANKDNNQHSPNENLRLGNYFEGIQAMYYILSTSVDRKE